MEAASSKGYIIRITTQSLSLSPPHGGWLDLDLDERGDEALCARCVVSALPVRAHVFHRPWFVDEKPIWALLLENVRSSSI